MSHFALGNGGHGSVDKPKIESFEPGVELQRSRYIGWERQPTRTGCCRICVTHGSRFVPLAQALSRAVPDSNRRVF